MAERILLDKDSVRSLWSKTSDTFLRKSGGTVTGLLTLNSGLQDISGDKSCVISDGEITLDNGDDYSLHLMPTGIVLQGVNSADYVYATDGSVVKVASLTEDCLPLAGGSMDKGAEVTFRQADSSDSGLVEENYGTMSLSAEKITLSGNLLSNAPTAELSADSLTFDSGNIIVTPENTSSEAYYGQSGLYYGPSSNRRVVFDNASAKFSVPVTLTDTLAAEGAVSIGGTLTVAGNSEVASLTASGDITAESSVSVADTLVIGDETNVRAYSLQAGNDAIAFYKNGTPGDTSVTPTSVKTGTVIADTLQLGQTSVTEGGLLQRTAAVEVLDSNGDTDSTYTVNDAWAAKYMGYYLSATSAGYSLITAVKMNHVDTGYRIAYVDVIFEDTERQTVTVNAAGSAAVLTGCTLMKVDDDTYRGAVTLAVAYQEDGTVDNESQYEIAY